MNECTPVELEKKKKNEKKTNKIIKTMIHQVN